MLQDVDEVRDSRLQQAVSRLSAHGVVFMVTAHKEGFKVRKKKKRSMETCILTREEKTPLPLTIVAWGL